MGVFNDTISFVLEQIRFADFENNYQRFLL